MGTTVIVANKLDNVATIVKELNTGDKITIEKGGDRVEVKVNERIPCYHKIALRDIKKGDIVIKYGEAMGIASSDILKGDYVHIHNVESKRARGDKKS